MLNRVDSEADVLGRLTGWLCDHGLLGQDQVARASAVASESGERIDRVLSRLGLARDQDLRDGFAAVLGLEPIEARAFPPEPPLIEALGLRFLTAACLLPNALHDGTLYIATADPLDQATLDAVALKTGYQVIACPAIASDIEAALERHKREADPAGPTTVETDTAADIARLRDQASETPVIQLVNQLIRRAVEARASDIHIEPDATGLRIRQRIDGRLREVDSPPPSLRAAIISRLKIMAQLNIAEQRLPQDGRIQIVIAGRDIDLRVATLPTLHGESVVLRLLDRSGLVLDFPGLGFAPEATARLETLLAQPNGMFLVTGPTGSGKTTTLYAALERLNAPDTKIITVEDPVEYQLAGVTQVQVKPQIGLGFAEIIRAILRNNPNIVMIGEIRDRETAEIAVQAALTGHLVLATLHTNSAAAAINRLRDMGVEDYLITATVIGVMAQRLVRRLCPTCRKPEEPALVRRVFGEAISGFCAATGCPDCGGSGYRGRTGVHEVLIVDEAIRAAILDRADQREIERRATTDGMIAMREDGLAKAARGEVSLAEVLQVSAAG